MENKDRSSIHSSVIDTVDSDMYNGYYALDYAYIFVDQMN